MTTRSLLPLIVLAAACEPEPEPSTTDGHGPIAEDIFAYMGEPVPYATPEQVETFERGFDVMVHRFSRAEGLGPGFNITFCGSCHEKPVMGGSAGLYRNFFINGIRTEDGAFFFGESAGNSSGVVRLYNYSDLTTPRPEMGANENVVGHRNPIPFFGVGLLAELPTSEIVKRADPDDVDGDGISGEVNMSEGFVGRFGMKSQAVSIEGFIRGPLNNHAGITTDPLSQEMKAALPVDSSNPELLEETRTGAFDWVGEALTWYAQAEAPQGPLTDSDDVPDPELSPQGLFDLVSFSMLLAPSPFDELTPEGERGREVFDALKCGACHTPRLQGPRGPIPAYSDLLVHDMGPENADGIEMGFASGSEFRTQPLWGVAATAPYLHDGRAQTLYEAVAMHGGEAQPHADAWAELEPSDQDALVEFLMSLGGRTEYTPGLVDLDKPVEKYGEWGGPREPLSGDEELDFLAGRTLFDFEFGFSDGVGAPRFNGDSCRACHFEPVLGGAGPRGVNVIRHGILNADGDYVAPSIGTILHRGTRLRDSNNAPQPDTSVYELRQTPHLFGLGLIQDIPEETILANADPDDLDGDGISGKPSWSDGPKLGRFGWKAQIPSIEEFVRDAVTIELGMTLEYEEGLSFGRIQDNDDIPDPEFAAEDVDLMEWYLHELGPPPRTPAEDPALAEAGEQVFADVGCADCHIPTLEGPDGPVALYSDLLLHEILPPDAVGIEEHSANMWEFRTAPLWGIAQTAPYLHDGSADTLDQAIVGHDGEAVTSRESYLALDPADQEALIAFLETL